MEIREYSHGHNCGGRFLGEGEPAVECRKQAKEPTCQDVLAVHPQTETGKCNTDLDCRKVLVLPARVTQNCDDQPGNPVASSGPLLYAHQRGSDDSEFGGYKNAVQKK